MSKLQKFFSYKFWIFVAPLIYAVGKLGMHIILYTEDATECACYYLATNAFLVAVILLTCFSFLKHSKNVMKALVGGILMYTCVTNLEYALEYTIYYENLANAIFSVVLALLSIAFFVIYLVLASNHKSNAKAVKINMIIGLLIPVCVILWEVYLIIFLENDILWGIFWSLAASGMVLLVMNIESKIDYFKQIRDQKEVEE